MQVREAYPHTSAAFPRLLNWDADFEWIEISSLAVVETLTAAMEQAQQDGPQALLALAGVIRTDLSSETRRIGDGEGAAHLDAARFIVAIPAIMTTVAMGIHGDGYGWLHWSASRTHDFDGRVNEGDYRLPPYDGAPAVMNCLCLSYLTEWITSAFMVARKLGGMDDWCEIIIDYCIEHVIGTLQAGDVRQGVPAIVTIANWAANRQDPRAEHLTRTLETFYRRPEIDDRSKATMAVLFTTSASRWTHQSHQAWAREALRDLRPVLIEHEVVQLLSVTINTVDDWIATRTEVLTEIRALADGYRAAAPGPDGTLALEARVSIIHPLIFSLVEFGAVADLMDVLWAWYGQDTFERADADVLFIGSAHGNGVAYLWPNGRLVVAGQEVEQTLETLLTHVSEALNEYFRGPEGDRAVELDERMIGAPAYHQVPGLVAALTNHYRLNQLTAALPQGWCPRSIVVVPAHRDPIQATLADALGWLAPMEASLAAPLPERPIQRLRIWPGETQTTDVEVAFLQAVGARAGWEVHVATAPLNAAAFKAFYEDVSTDLLWVIGHGEQSPFRQDQSGLVLEDGAVLTAAEIAGFSRPQTGRRLLVLNICSATATQNRGGLARIGFGHELTTNDQRVVGHLWPIDYYAALAFGCSLALDLMALPVAEALRATMVRMQDPARLVQDLQTLDPASEALALLGSERAARQVANLLSWGSPVLLT